MLPQECVQLHTATQTVHVPVPQIQEQSAVTVNSQFPITAVEASQVGGSFSLSEEFAAPVELTTINTSSTSTRSFAPVYNQIRQKPFDAAETTQNTVDTPPPPPPPLPPSPPARAPRRPAATIVLMISRTCLTCALSSSLLWLLRWKASRMRLEGLRCLPSG